LFGNPEGEDHAEDAGVDTKIIVKWISGIQDGNVCTGCIRPMRGTSGELL